MRATSEGGHAGRSTPGFRISPESVSLILQNSSTCAVPRSDRKAGRSGQRSGQAAGETLRVIVFRPVGLSTWKRISSMGPWRPVGASETSVIKLSAACRWDPATKRRGAAKSQVRSSCVTKPNLAIEVRTSRSRTELRLKSCLAAHVLHSASHQHLQPPHTPPSTAEGKHPNRGLGRHLHAGSDRLGRPHILL